MHFPQWRMELFVWVSVLVLPAIGAAENLSGTWEFTIMRFGEPMVRRATLQDAGGKISGTSRNVKFEGTMQGETVKLEAHFPNGKPMGSFSGTLLEGVMIGTAKVFGDQPATWTAKRAVERAPGMPTTRRFTPRAFHRAFSSSIEPVMHLHPGDTVTTWTVDAGGVDANGTHRSLGGNPLTGPFYIEGALPGDTLVVKFNRIRLNRDTAESGDSIASARVTPDYFKEAKPLEKFESQWRLDREHGTAVLAHPTERLKNFVVKLNPMLGCVGVAPPGNQSFQSGHLGSFGGNMDYNQIREGTTLYLPVYHTGALLFVGDGHAAEGDGELTGDALETSMDVEFTVNVVQDQSADMPRAENADYLMAMGVGGSLDEAVQLATTELARWLERDYKLNSTETAVVLGTSARYDIAELVDPKVNVVAKISKSALAPLRQ
jgi:amidase